MIKNRRVLLFAITNRYQILLLCCVAAAALVFWAPFAAHWPAGLAYAAAAAAAALVATALWLFIHLSCRRVDRLLTRDLDPAAYGLAYHTLYSKLKNKAVPSAVHFLINIGLGMIETGRAKDAAALFSRMGRFKTRAGKRGLLRFYTHLARAQIEFGALSNAQTTLNTTARLLVHLRLGARMHRRYAAHHTENHMRLGLALGQAGDAQSVFIEALAGARSEYARVLAQSALGSAYLLQGEHEKAREALEYTAAHGNRLFAAKQARALLETFSAPG